MLCKLLFLKKNNLVVFDPPPGCLCGLVRRLQGLAVAAQPREAGDALLVVDLGKKINYIKKNKTFLGQGIRDLA